MRNLKNGPNTSASEIKVNRGELVGTFPPVSPPFNVVSALSPPTAFSQLDDDDLLSPPVMAKFIDVEVSTLAHWRSTGRYDLPFFKAGRLVRYRVGDARQFIKRRTMTQTV